MIKLPTRRSYVLSDGRTVRRLDWMPHRSTGRIWRGWKWQLGRLWIDYRHSQDGPGRILTGPAGRVGADVDLEGQMTKPPNARIVAWLRAFEEEDGDWFSIYPADVVAWLADQIEAGAHEEGERTDGAT
jgi:hypothetical protein